MIDEIKDSTSIAMTAAPNPMAMPLSVCRENPFKISLFIASSLILVDDLAIFIDMRRALQYA